MLQDSVGDRAVEAKHGHLNFRPLMVSDLFLTLWQLETGVLLKNYIINYKLFNLLLAGMIVQTQKGEEMDIKENNDNKRKC